MLFAKALCAILILSLTHFGKSQNLKTDNNSTVKSVVYMEKMEQEKLPPKPVVDERISAEYGRDFIVKMLTKWATMGDIEIAMYDRDRNFKTSAIDEKVKMELNKRSGIYFICCTHGRRDEIYPVYVGMTTQTFYGRLNQHINNDNGQLKEIEKEKWERYSCNKFTLYIKQADTAVAKFLESTFLAAFDFARNTQENENRRRYLETRFSNELVARDHFHKILMMKKEYLENAIDELK